MSGLDRRAVLQLRAEHDGADGCTAYCRPHEGRHADLFHNWSSGDPDTIQTPEFWRADWERVGLRIVRWEPAEAPVPTDYRLTPEHGRAYLIIWEPLGGD